MGKKADKEQEIRELHNINALNLEAALPLDKPPKNEVQHSLFWALHERKQTIRKEKEKNNDGERTTLAQQHMSCFRYSGRM